jgi:hypothetical protein
MFEVFLFINAHNVMNIYTSLRFVLFNPFSDIPDYYVLVVLSLEASELASKVHRVRVAEKRRTTSMAPATLGISLIKIDRRVDYTAFAYGTTPNAESIPSSK